MAFDWRLNSENPMVDDCYQENRRELSGRNSDGEPYDFYPKSHQCDLCGETHPDYMYYTNEAMVVCAGCLEEIGGRGWERA